MTSTDDGSEWGALSENEGIVVEEAGRAGTADEGTATDSKEDEMIGTTVGATSDVVTTSTEVAAVVCSKIEVE